MNVGGWIGVVVSLVCVCVMDVLLQVIHWHFQRLAQSPQPESKIGVIRAETLRMFIADTNPLHNRCKLGVWIR